MARFDEFNLNVEFRYRGALIEFPTKRPYKAEILEDELAVARLAGFLIKIFAGRIRSECKDGKCRVPVSFRLLKNCTRMSLGNLLPEIRSLGSADNLVSSTRRLPVYSEYRQCLGLTMLSLRSAAVCA